PSLLLLFVLGRYGLLNLGLFLGRATLRVRLMGLIDLGGLIVLSQLLALLLLGGRDRVFVTLVRAANLGEVRRFLAVSHGLRRCEALRLFSADLDGVTLSDDPIALDASRL